MPDYVLAFRGGMPRTPDEGRQMMADWTAWAEGLGKNLVNPGAGFGKSRYLTGPGTEAACPSPLSGFTIVRADSIEAALDLARRNPIFGLGGTIEVVEAMQM